MRSALFFLLLLGAAPLAAHAACQDLAASCVLLSWQMNANASDPPVGFRIFRAIAGGQYGLLTTAAAKPANAPQMCHEAIPSAQFSCESDGLQAGVSYSFYVVSVDAQGNVSAPSNIFTYLTPSPGSVSGLGGCPQ